MNEIEHEPFYTFEETPREAYDKMVRHFSKPGARLGMEDGNPTACSYKTKSGYKCAVGCLIPDDAYKDAFDTGETDDGWSSDGTDISALYSSGMVDFAHTQTLAFCRSAQVIHDKVSNENFDNLDDAVSKFLADLNGLWQDEYEGVV